MMIAKVDGYHVPATAHNTDGYWEPACGGTETPFKTRAGATLLYVYNPVLHKHAYLNVETDLLLSDDEASALM
jgi:hypothetical protein